MKPPAIGWRRTARGFGWAFALGVSATVATSIGWRALQVSEARAASATRENLALSLMAHAAQDVATGRMVPQRWLAANPFEALRWQPDDYCGELADTQPPRRGCWHYLPQRGWILYRSRFGGAETGTGIDAYALTQVPDEATAGTPANGLVSLELQPVPAMELVGWLTGNKGHAQE